MGATVAQYLNINNSYYNTSTSHPSLPLAAHGDGPSKIQDEGRPSAGYLSALRQGKSPGGTGKQKGQEENGATRRFRDRDHRGDEGAWLWRTSQQTLTI